VGTVTVPLNTNQEAALEHPVRSAIHDFLKNYDKPASLGEIAEGIDGRDIAVVFYHLNRLVNVELVEKVWGAERYRVVGAK
jgi:predicted MarR family transcription regulator